MPRGHFRQMLIWRQRKVNSLLCVGLDPLVAKMPEEFEDEFVDVGKAVLTWMERIVDATAPFACMYKAQHAHWEAIPCGAGMKWLTMLIGYIHLKYPDIPVMVDCKRGDIDRTQACYREAHFGYENADAMNFNPYMGKSTISNLVDEKRPGRGLVGLGRTSNPAAWEIQDQFLADGRRVWEMMVERTMTWAKELSVIADAGIVMGAAHQDPDRLDRVYADHLVRAREIVSDQLWFLIPGIGRQGGFIGETVQAAYIGWGSMVINSSSDITEASREFDYAQAAAAKAEQTRDLINQHRPRLVGKE